MSLTTKTYVGAKLEPYLDPESALTESVPFDVNLTIAKGTLLGIVTATGKRKAYVSGNSDGSQTAKEVAMYDLTTDASGKVSINGDTLTTFDSAPVYQRGYFRTTELIGLDAGAVASLGRLTDGSVANGVLHIT